MPRSGPDTTPPGPDADQAHRRLGAVLAGVGAGAAAWAVAVGTNRSLRVVDGPSMLPTLAPDDHLVTVPPSLRRPRRGDVVVLAAGALAPTASVKRLVGLPGERVVLLDGHVHVDGSWWDLGVAAPIDEDHDLVAGPDQVVVLGDNRAASTDSRRRGPVPADAIERVAVARLRPWRTLEGDLHRLGAVRRRDAVRVVVLDPDDRTLLFRVADVDGVVPDWWETPGGGLQPGEDHARAAVRELSEEVGHRDVAVHDLGHVAERDSTLFGARLHRVEATWAARVPDDTVSTAGWTASEHLDHRDWAWFTRDDLLALDAVTHPVDVVEVYDRARDRLATPTSSPPRPDEDDHDEPG